MPFTAACPFCPTKMLNVPDNVMGASVRCPQCGNYFTAVPPEAAQPGGGGAAGRSYLVPASEAAAQEAAPAATALAAGSTPANPASAVTAQAVATAPLQVPSVRPLAYPVTVPDLPPPPVPVHGHGWISPWGAAGLLLAGAALFQAFLLQIRPLTIGLTLLGSLIVLLGFVVTLDHGRLRDRVWLAMAALLNGGVMVLALVAPRVLNPYWALDVPVPRTNPDEQTLVSRQKATEANPIGQDDWADAATQTIRQDDIVIRVDSAQLSVAETKDNKPAAAALLIHVRLVNLRHDRKIPFDGFRSDTNTPALTSDTGQSFPFREQRHRKMVKGGLAFEARSTPRTIYLMPAGHVDCQLVFEVPPSVRGGFKLELPAQAWGRRGSCRIRIGELFESPVRQLPKAKGK